MTIFQQKNRLRRDILSFSQGNPFFKNSQIRGLWEQFNFIAVADLHHPKNLPLDPALI